MRRKNLIAMLFCALIFSAPMAHAQQDVVDVTVDIFKDGQPSTPDQNPTGRIDNIPTKIVFNIGDTGLLTGSVLIVSAYAPAPPNVRRSSPLMLGQTRLLLTDMGSPLKVIIATPSAVTQDLEYTRIEATIINANDVVIFDLKEPGKYDGYDAPILNLTHIGKTLDVKPVVNSAELVSETIRGKIRINGKAPKFAGSNLVTRLVEDGLAGGNYSIVLGEMRQILDGKRAPFAFKFEGLIDPSQSEIPLALEVWIEDWAGRKTHVTPAPTPYTGPKTRYRIRLDAIGPQVYNPMPSKMAINKAISKTVIAKKTVAKVKSNPKPKPTTKPKQKIFAAKKIVKKTNPVMTTKSTAKSTAKPAVTNKQVFQIAAKTRPKAISLPPYQRIAGKAHFNASKGLPRGSVLVAELERRNNSNRPALLASTRVFLDGLSGAVSFKLKANTTDLDPTLSPARLRVRIEDKNGKLFFSNLGGATVRKGFNTVTLTTSPNY
ncbi:MAG: hypothetical protein COB92_05055 [Robiginitomaculum sp.]|nr:MAG: hypothetical protein COB92_05055 [Robiginitomaculum sp.]